MLLNKGRHPYTNETIVPEEVVEHVAYGRSVSHGKPPFPELVSMPHKSYMSCLMSLNRAPKFMVLVNGDIRTKATISLSMGGEILGIGLKWRVFQTTIWALLLFPTMSLETFYLKP